MEEKLKDKEFAQWLEDVIHGMFDYNPNKMCFVARTQDGHTLTAYYNASTEDMALFAHSINADVMMEIAMNNATRIVAAAADQGDWDEDG